MWCLLDAGLVSPMEEKRERWRKAPFRLNDKGGSYEEEYYYLV